MTDYKSVNEITLHPLVSVLLPVFNGELYLREAIESILEQTYTNLELIIINDGSSDDSERIILSFHDPRISYYRQENQGLSATLNRGIGLSAGDFIARQDQDDISLPLRLERQIAFLEANPCCGMLGTWSEIWVDCLRTDRAHRHPTDDVSLQYALLFNNPFVHSSVMIRKEVFRTVGLYCNDSSRQPPEDYELWSRVSRKYEVSNIPEILLIYREVPKSMSRASANPFLDKLVNISAENLAWVTGRSCTDTAARDLAALVHGAMHLVSPRPNFVEITCLLRCAAERVGCRAEKEDRFVKEETEICLRLIRKKYLLHRYGETLGKIMIVYDKFHP